MAVFGVDLARLAPVLLASLAVLFAAAVAVLVLRGRMVRWLAGRPVSTPSVKPNWGKRVGVVVTGLLVLAAAGVIALVVVATQVGFYQARMKVKQVDLFHLVDLDLTAFTPIAVESLAWVFTSMAVVLVLCNRSATRWTNSMWFFASIAALVNAWNNLHQGDWLGGTVTGGLSLAGPYMVHMYVMFCRNMAHGKSIDQTSADFTARIDRLVAVVAASFGHVADHVVHPIIAVRTIGVWRGHRGMSYDMAWLISSANWRAGVKQRLREARVLVAETAAEPTVTEPDVEGVTDESPHGPETPLPAPADETVSDAVLTEVGDEDPLLLALHGVTSPAELIAAWEADQVRDTVTGSDLGSEGVNEDRERGESRPGHAVDDGPVTRESHRESDRDSRRDTRRSRPKSRRESGRVTARDSRRDTQRDSRTERGSSHGRDSDAATVAETSHRDRIIARYYELLDADTDPAGVVRAKEAKDLGVDRGLLSRTFKECAEGLHPRPAGSPEQEDRS